MASKALHKLLDKRELINNEILSHQLDIAALSSKMDKLEKKLDKELNKEIKVKCQLCDKTIDSVLSTSRAENGTIKYYNKVCMLCANKSNSKGKEKFKKTNREK